MSWTGYILRIVKRYYDFKTFDHIIRVAGYVANNSTIPDEKNGYLYLVGNNA